MVLKVNMNRSGDNVLLCRYMQEKVHYFNLRWRCSSASGRISTTIGAITVDSVVTPSGELRGQGRCAVFAGKTVGSTPERLRGEVLTMRRYTNLRLPLPYPSAARTTTTTTTTSGLVYVVLTFSIEWSCFFV